MHSDDFQMFSDSLSRKTLL